jgi:hypothetical protein
MNIYAIVQRLSSTNNISGLRIEVLYRKCVSTVTSNGGPLAPHFFPIAVRAEKSAHLFGSPTNVGCWEQQLVYRTNFPFSKWQAYITIWPLALLNVSKVTRLRTSYATDGESNKRSFLYVPTVTERTPVVSCDWDQNFM